MRKTPFDGAKANVQGGRKGPPNVFDLARIPTIKKVVEERKAPVKSTGLGPNRVDTRTPSQKMDQKSVPFTFDRQKGTQTKIRDKSLAVDVPEGFVRSETTGKLYKEPKTSEEEDAIIAEDARHEAKIQAELGVEGKAVTRANRSDIEKATEAQTNISEGFRNLPIVKGVADFIDAPIRALGEMGGPRGPDPAFVKPGQNYGLESLYGPGTQMATNAADTIGRGSAVPQELRTLLDPASDPSQQTGAALNLTGTFAEALLTALGVQQGAGAVKGALGSQPVKNLLAKSPIIQRFNPNALDAQGVPIRGGTNPVSGGQFTPEADDVMARFNNMNLEMGVPSPRDVPNVAAPRPPAMTPDAAYNMRMQALNAMAKRAKDAGDFAGEAKIKATIKQITNEFNAANFPTKTKTKTSKATDPVQPTDEFGPPTNQTSDGSMSYLDNNARAQLKTAKVTKLRALEGELLAKGALNPVEREMLKRIQKRLGAKAAPSAEKAAEVAARTEAIRAGRATTNNPDDLYERFKKWRDEGGDAQEFHQKNGLSEEEGMALGRRRQAEKEALENAAHDAEVAKGTQRMAETMADPSSASDDALREAIEIQKRHVIAHGGRMGFSPSTGEFGALAPTADYEGFVAGLKKLETELARRTGTSPTATAPQPSGVATATGPTRQYMLGGQEGARAKMTFASKEQEALYDLGSAQKTTRRDRGRTQDSPAYKARQERLANATSEELAEASRVYDDVRAQMKGAKDGETHILRPTGKTALKVVDGGQPTPPRPAIRPVAEVASTARANQGMTQPTRIPTKAKPATPPSPVKETVTGKPIAEVQKTAQVQTPGATMPTDADVLRKRLKDAINRKDYATPADRLDAISEARKAVDEADARARTERMKAETSPEQTYREEVFKAAQKKLREGGEIIVQTATRATRFQSKHADLLQWDPRGKTLVMVSGKRKDAIVGDVLDRIAAQVGVKRGPAPVAQVAQGAKVQTKPQPVASPVKEVARPAPVGMDGLTRAQRKAKTNPPKPELPPVHPMAKQKLDDAIERTDVDSLKELLHTGNPRLRAMFEEKTGVKLPKTVRGTHDLLDQLGATKKTVSDALNAGKTVEQARDEAMAAMAKTKPTPVTTKPNPDAIFDQIDKAKEQHPGVLMATRVGDFYEFYGKDAETVAQALEITLTGRQTATRGRIAMSGVPYHAVERYLAKLIEKGHRVALLDQLEDPKLAKGVVSRGVTKVLDPPTAKTAKASDPVKPVAEVVKSPEQAASPIIRAAHTPAKGKTKIPTAKTDANGLTAVQREYILKKLDETDPETTIEIDVPGDGSFKIGGGSMRESFRKVVESKKGVPTERGSNSTRNLIGVPDDATRNQLVKTFGSVEEAAKRLRAEADRIAKLPVSDPAKSQAKKIAKEAEDMAYGDQRLAELAEQAAIKLKKQQAAPEPVILSRKGKIFEIRDDIGEERTINLNHLRRYSLLNKGVYDIALAYSQD